MDTEQLDPLAEILLYSFLETRTYSQAFRDDYGQPPTSAAKIQHLRSVAQASINRDERYHLGSDYAEYGRVEISDLAHARQYLLRSSASVSIEALKQAQNTSLFNAAQYIESPVVMLVYKFHQNGLDLAVAPARHQVKRTRLEARATPTYIDTWPYVPVGDTDPFDQHGTDAFEDLGEIDAFDEEEEGGVE